MYPRMSWDKGLEARDKPTDQRYSTGLDYYGRPVVRDATEILIGQPRVVV